MAAASFLYACTISAITSRASKTAINPPLPDENSSRALPRPYMVRWVQSLHCSEPLAGLGARLALG
jgi:hypothetical protein